MPDLRPADDCATCGFDATRWNDTDTIRTLHHTAGLLGLWSSVAADQADEPSVVDPIAAVAATQRAMNDLIGTALDRPGAEAGPGISPGPGPGSGPSAPASWSAPAPGAAGNAIDRDGALAAAASAGDALHRRLSGLGEGDWEHGVVVDGRLHTVRWASRRAVHDLWHHLGDIALATTGLGCRTGVLHGRVAVVNSSDGGVPKTPVDGADVDLGGVVGDRQATRIHHGRPWQALCLYSAEVIDALRAEGHPVAPGTTGENLTLSGLDWAALRAGDVLEVGGVVCQLSSPADPCATIAGSFTGRAFGRIDHHRHPGWSRWYASVLTPGRVTSVDAVTVRAPVPADRARAS